MKTIKLISAIVCLHCIITNSFAQYYQPTGTTGLTIENAGNVGIGIITPAHKLDVAGSFNSSLGNYGIANSGNFLGLGMSGTGAYYDDGSGNQYVSGILDMSGFGGPRAGMTAYINNNTGTQSMLMTEPDGSRLIYTENNASPIGSADVGYANQNTGIQTALRCTNGNAMLQYTLSGSSIDNFLTVNGDDDGIYLSTTNSLGSNANVKLHANDGLMIDGVNVYADRGLYVNAGGHATGQIDLSGNLNLETKLMLVPAGGGTFSTQYRNDLFTDEEPLFIQKSLNKLAIGNVLTTDHTNWDNKLDIGGSVHFLSYKSSTGAVSGNKFLEVAFDGDLDYATIAAKNHTNGDQGIAMGKWIGIGGAPNVAAALKVHGKTLTQQFQLTNGASLGYVFTSDADGNAYWHDPVGANLGHWTKTTGNHIYKNNGGSVGIGTTSPQALLHVNGTVEINGKTIIGNEQITSGVHTDFQLAVAGKILAKEVVITTTGWADYVFDKDYSLKSLDDLEKFIVEHKHLPEIPSEKEACLDGVSMGEMNVLLLKKIEELTLYAIQLNKDFIEFKECNSSR